MSKKQESYPIKPDHKGIEERWHERFGNANSGRSNFEKCVERRLRPDGRLEINCKRGLWGASGLDRHQVEREASHYWHQYAVDGDYNELLNTNSEDAPHNQALSE